MEINTKEDPMSVGDNLLDNLLYERAHQLDRFNRPE
jgi:hypothetical protein